MNRYNRHDKRSKFPPWINQFLKEDHCLNLSTDIAIEKMKVFLKQMGQGIDREALHSILMDEEQVAGRKKQKLGESDNVTTNTNQLQIQTQSQSNSQDSIPKITEEIIDTIETKSNETSMDIVENIEKK